MSRKFSDDVTADLSSSGYHMHARPGGVLPDRDDVAAAGVFAQRAQAYATAELVAEQRIANLIAYLAQVPYQTALRAQLTDEIEERLGIEPAS